MGTCPTFIIGDLMFSQLEAAGNFFIFDDSYITRTEAGEIVDQALKNRNVPDPEDRAQRLLDHAARVREDDRWCIPESMSQTILTWRWRRERAKCLNLPLPPMLETLTRDRSRKPKAG